MIRSLAAAGAGLLLLIAPAAAHAYTALLADPATPAHWCAARVTVHADGRVPPGASLSDLEAAIAQAAATWNEPTCALVELDPAEPLDGPTDGAIVVGWADPAELPADLSADAAAVTRTVYGDDGCIVSAHVMLNPAFHFELAPVYVPGDTADLISVVTHELGHALGLSHSRHRDATMFFAGGDPRMRTLEDDDRRALCFLYGAEPTGAGQPCDACVRDGDCAPGARCLLEPAGDAAFCGAACESDADCPDDFACVDVAGAGNQCLPRNGTCAERGANIPVGQRCYGPATCESGLCWPTNTTAYCTQPCRPAESASDCPSGTQCVPGGPGCTVHSQTACGRCAPVGDVPLGAPCADSTQCRSGSCALAFGAVQGHCTARCDSDADCTQPTRCVLGLCVAPGPRPTGAPCGSPYECQGAICVPGEQQQRCASPCDGPADCPSSALCTSFAAGRACATDADCPGGAVCATQAGLCTCAGDDECPAGARCAVLPNDASGGLPVCAARLCAWLPGKKPFVGEYCDPAGVCFGDGVDCVAGGSDWGVCRTRCEPGASDCGEGYACTPDPDGTEGHCMPPGEAGEQSESPPPAPAPVPLAPPGALDASGWKPLASAAGGGGCASSVPRSANPWPWFVALAWVVVGAVRERGRRWMRRSGRAL